MNWLDIHGVALRYQLRRGSGLTLVLLHEMGGSVESWRDVIERLPQSRAEERRGGEEGSTPWQQDS